LLAIFLDFRFLTSKFSTIVLGGTAASHTFSGMGGGTFFTNPLFCSPQRVAPSGTGGVQRLCAIPHRPSALRSFLPGGMVKCCPSHIFYDILLDYVNLNRLSEIFKHFSKPYLANSGERDEKYGQNQ
jgi:hypothetical protein